jgi:hypothetical protein
MAETMGMMIFMRLDALIGPYPSTFGQSPWSRHDQRFGLRLPDAG